MKIIDLLNKIANGEEVPKKIKIGYDVLIHNEKYNLFLQDYYNEINKLNENEYFLMLSKLKFMFEHLYELGLDAVSIWVDDELKGFYLAYSRKKNYILEALLPLKEVEAILFDFIVMKAYNNKLELVSFDKLEESLNCIR